MPLKEIKASNQFDKGEHYDDAADDDGDDDADGYDGDCDDDEDENIEVGL